MGIALNNYYENLDDEYTNVRNTNDDPHAISQYKGYLHDERILKWLLKEKQN